MNLNVEIIMPRHPNFLRLKGEKGTIDIGDLSDEAYTEFEHQYMESFKNHWLKRKKNLSSLKP